MTEIDATLNLEVPNLSLLDAATGPNGSGDLSISSRWLRPALS